MIKSASNRKVCPPNANRFARIVSFFTIITLRRTSLNSKRSLQQHRTSLIMAK
jgi:hypothetical protein